MNAVRASLLVAVATTVLGCSSQQIHRTLYATGESWQRNQCEQLADGGAGRDRCLTRADTSYDAYRPQASAAPQR